MQGNDFWNQQYAGQEFRYGKKPEAFFEKFIGRLTPGKLLLPGEGEGRHAVYAAKAGWQVDAVDFSAEARDKALAYAAEEGVEINYQLGDVMKIKADYDAYDAIAVMFVHMPPAERRQFHQRLVSFLKPDGGNFYLMAFSKKQLDYSSGGPKDESMLYTKEELMKDFSQLDIDMVVEEEIELDAGHGHEGKGVVITLSAVRHMRDTSTDRTTIDLG